MAVVIPLVLGALGASTMVSTIVGIAFAVTGISDKINKAAASVFGEDLVGLANIAGMAFGAAGGFSGAEAGINGLDSIPTEGMDSFNLADAADVAGNSGLEAMGESILNTDPGLAAAAYSDAPASMSGFNLADAAGAGTTALQDTISAASQPAGSALREANAAPVEAPAKSLQGMQGEGAAAAQQPQATQAVTQSAARDVMAGRGASAASATAAQGGNLFGLSDGMLKMGGSVLKGAAGAYQNAQARKDANKARDENRRRYDQEWADMAAQRNIGGAGFRQTR